jgi:hypothetical protein
MAWADDSWDGALIVMERGFPESPATILVEITE